jgi:hypothetical protein
LSYARVHKSTNRAGLLVVEIDWRIGTAGGNRYDEEGRPPSNDLVSALPRANHVALQGPGPNNKGATTELNERAIISCTTPSDRLHQKSLDSMQAMGQQYTLSSLCVCPSQVSSSCQPPGHRFRHGSRRRRRPRSECATSALSISSVGPPESKLPAPFRLRLSLPRRVPLPEVPQYAVPSSQRHQNLGLHRRPAQLRHTPSERVSRSRRPAGCLRSPTRWKPS